MPALSRTCVSVCVIALGVSLTACQPKRRPMPKTDTQSQAQTTPESQLLALEDRRSLGGGQVEQWASTAEDPKLRARALLALARIAAPQTQGTVVKALRDPEPLVRYEAAFAAGQLGTWHPLPEADRAALVGALLEAEAEETDVPVRQAQLEALGKQATPAAIDRLLERILLSDRPEVAARAALSLGVAARRDAVIPSRAVTALAPLMRQEADAGARFGAAYALSVSKLAGARPALLLCTQDAQSDIRLLCAKGLGEVGQDADAVGLKRLLDDPDYRVVVEATRALAKLAARCKSAACPALGALADLRFRLDRLEAGDLAGGGQPILALAQQGVPMIGRPLLTQLRGRVVGMAQAQPNLRKDLARLDCRLAAAMDRQLGQLAEVVSCGGGFVSEPDRLALGLKEIAQTPPADPGKRAQEVTAYLRHPEAKVKLAAIDALGESKAPSAVEVLRPFVTHEDLPVAVAAANALGKLGDGESVAGIRQLSQRVTLAPQHAEPVANALAALNAKDAEVELRAWLNHPHVHLRNSAAKALTKLTGQPVQPGHVERPEAPFRAPYLPKTAKFLVKTEKGEFEVEPFFDSPLTAGHMYALAQRGYFRNLTFHRVVPNFVAQGGDPRGDGSGGPGTTLRCEVNHQPYARGVVGMALSGLDTGGSQFFVTHSPQPHLDGRYTAFGRVTSGQEVVDRLLEGDPILEINAR